MILNENSLRQFDLIQTLKQTDTIRNDNFLEIDEGAKNYLTTSLNIKIEDLNKG